MFNRTKPMLLSALIAVALLIPGYAQADGSQDNSATARADVIEEIVVIGTKNRPGRKFDRNDDIAPVFNKPSRFELQLFPVYDPDDPYRRTVNFQLHDPIKNVGIVEVFRIRFGGKRS